MKIFSVVIFFFFIFCLSSNSAVNTWQGKNSDWFSGENWSLGKSPVSGDKNDVVIPGGLNNYPVLTSDIVIDGSLVIEKNATLTLSGHNITLLNLDNAAKKGFSVLAFTFHEQYFWDKKLEDYARHKGESKSSDL